MKVNKQKSSKLVRKGKNFQCGMRQSYKNRKNQMMENRVQPNSANFINSEPFSTESEKIPMYFNNSSQEYSFASVSHKNQLDTIEEDYLDYEPSEVEAPQQSSTNPVIEYKESNYVNNEQREFNSMVSHNNNIQSQYSFSNGPGRPSINKETSTYCARNFAAKNDEKFMRIDGILENHTNENNNFSTCNEFVNEERRLTSLNNNTLDDLKVDFKGIDIKITRFTKNSSQIKHVDDNLNRNESNLRFLHNSPNLDRMSIDKYIPEGGRNMEKQFFIEKGENENISRCSRANSNTFQKNIENRNSKFGPKIVIHENFVRPSGKPNKKQFTFSSNQNRKWPKNNNFHDSNSSTGTYFVNDMPELDNDASKGHSQKSSEQGSVKICSERSTSPIGNKDEDQVTGKKEFITKWLMQNKKDDFAELLDSLCESHFTGGCNYNRCTKKHSLEYITKVIHQANSEEFEKFYKLTLRKEFWFKCLFDTFFECFKLTARAGEIFLIDMIDDVYKVFNDTLIDKTSYISKIIKGLQELGLSFSDAIENIILKYGTSQLWLTDILLFLITKEPNLVKHWCLVQKIIRCRKEKVDSEVTTKILMAAFESYPPNKDLCKKICFDIFEKNLADLDKIPQHFQNYVRKMLGNRLECDDKGQDADPEETYSPDVVLTEEQHEERKGVKRDYAVALECSSHSSSESLESREEFQDYDKTIAIEQETSRSSGENSISDNNSSKVKIASSNGYNSSRSINERVVKRFVKNVDAIQGSQIPANFIAHPSYLPKIDPKFQCNVSLHNLLPEVYSFNPDVSIQDLRRLKTALKEADSAAYLQVLKLYSDPYSIENFIVNVLTLLKSMRKSKDIYSAFMSLLESLEKNDECNTNDKFVKVSTEVLALNLVFMLNGKGFSRFCRNILMKLKDWHSLVTSKIFLNHCNSKSHMGRYIYIISILISADDLPWANEMFQVKALRLLEPAITWPYYYKPADVAARNRVMQSFFEKGFSHNIFVVNDLLRYIRFMNEGLVDGFDLSMWFNEKILSMLEKEEENRSNLIFLCNDVINYYEQFMDRHLLQAYMLHIEKYIENNKAFKLFRICCRKGVYQEYRVDQHVLYIPTNFNNFEIFCTLHCCFGTFKENHKFPSGFHIEIVMPENEQREELLIVEEKFRTNRSIFKVFETICLLLESEYNIIVEQPVQSKIFISQAMFYKFLSG